MLSTEEIWTRLGDPLRVFFGRRVQDANVAEDLLQESFVRVHDKLATLGDEERLVPWVFRIARNLLAEHRRGRRAADELGEDDVVVSAAPDEDNFNAEVERWLGAMIAELPPDYAQALELTEIEGLSQKAVAERLGLSLSGARTRIQRGRERLRARLLDCCHLDFDRRGNVVGYERRGGCAGCSSG
jgi:RNA polymerase sigma-70 factor (ECF subfamily)